MSLVRAWLVAIGAYAAGEIVLGVVVFTVRPALTGDPVAELLWGGLPTLIIYAAVAAAAALAHRRPGRRRPAAVLPVPVAALAGSTVLPLVAGGAVDGTGLVLGVLAGAVGTVAGWQAVDRLRSPTSAAADSYDF